VPLNTDRWTYFFCLIWGELVMEFRLQVAVRLGPTSAFLAFLAVSCEPQK
jgi:hypothetical protein